MQISLKQLSDNSFLLSKIRFWIWNSHSDIRLWLCNQQRWLRTTNHLATAWELEMLWFIAIALRFKTVLDLCRDFAWSCKFKSTGLASWTSEFVFSINKTVESPPNQRAFKTVFSNKESINLRNFGQRKFLDKLSNYIAKASALAWLNSAAP